MERGHWEQDRGKDTGGRTVMGTVGTGLWMETGSRMEAVEARRGQRCWEGNGDIGGQIWRHWEQDGDGGPG